MTTFNKAHPLDQLEHDPHESDAEAWERFRAWLTDAMTVPQPNFRTWPRRRNMRLTNKAIRRERFSPRVEITAGEGNIFLAFTPLDRVLRGGLPAFRRNGLRRLGFSAPVPGYGMWSARFARDDQERAAQVVVSVFRDVFHVPGPRELSFAEDDDELRGVVRPDVTEDHLANPAEVVVEEWFAERGTRGRGTKKNRDAWDEFFLDLVDVVDMLGTGDVLRLEPDIGETSTRPYLDVTAGQAAGHLDLMLPIAGAGDFHLASGAAEHLDALGLEDSGAERCAGTAGYEDQWLETVIVSIFRDAFGIKHPGALRRVHLRSSRDGRELDDIRPEALNLPWDSLEGRDLKPYRDRIEHYRPDDLQPDFVATVCGDDPRVIGDLIGHYEEMTVLWWAYMHVDDLSVDERQSFVFEKSEMGLNQGRIRVLRDALRLVVEDQERHGRRPPESAYWPDDDADVEVTVHVLRGDGSKPAEVRRDLTPYLTKMSSTPGRELTPEFLARMCRNDADLLGDLIRHHEQRAMRLWVSAGHKGLPGGSTKAPTKPRPLVVCLREQSRLRRALRLVVEKQLANET